MTEAETIRVERHIAAPPASVFRYLTEPELWARWQGEHADLDPVPGGIFRVRMLGGQTVEGRYLEVEQDSRVVVTWGWLDHPRMPPGATTVVIELVPEGEGTLVRLTHRGLPAEDLPIHRTGWEAYLPRLVSAAQGGDPGAPPS